MAQFRFNEGFAGHDRKDQIDNGHDDRYRYRRIAQEGQAFRDIDVLRAVFLIAEMLAEPAGKSIADIASMAHCHGIPTGNDAHVWLTECRGDRQQSAFEDTTKQNSRDARAHAGGYEDDSRQAEAERFCPDFHRYYTK